MKKAETTFRMSAFVRSSFGSSSGRIVTRARMNGKLVGELLDRDPREPLPDDPDVPVGESRHLLNEERAPRPVDIVRARRLDVLVDLRENAHDLASGERFVDEPDEIRIGEDERDEHVGEYDGVVDRNDRELLRNLAKKFASFGYGVDFVTYSMASARRFQSISTFFTYSAGSSLRIRIWSIPFE